MLGPPFTRKPARGAPGAGSPLGRTGQQRCDFGGPIHGTIQQKSVDEGLAFIGEPGTNNVDFQFPPGGDDWQHGPGYDRPASVQEEWRAETRAVGKEKEAVEKLKAANWA